MTLPPVIRVFFAVDLPSSIKEKLGIFMGALKKKSKSNTIRWTKPDNLHITLQFLPEVRTEDLPELIGHVKGEIARVRGLQFTLSALQLFPNPYRPRVIVVDVVPQNELQTLSRLIGRGVQATRYEVENRPFRGHLTLGRIKQPKEISLTFLSELTVPEVGKVEINEVILFRSEPQPEGSTYSVLERIALNEPFSLTYS